MLTRIPATDEEKYELKITTRVSFSWNISILIEKQRLRSKTRNLSSNRFRSSKLSELENNSVHLILTISVTQNIARIKRRVIAFLCVFILFKHHESWCNKHFIMLTIFPAKFYVNKYYFIWKSIREMLTFILFAIDDDNDVLIFRLFFMRAFNLTFNSFST